MSTPLVSRFARAAAIGLLMVFGAACGGSATSGPGPGDGGSLANAADASVDGSVDVAPPSDDAGGASDAGSDTGSVVGGPCDFRTCPQGCCDANGTCQMGSPTFCGTGGAACATCPSGTECLYNYHCECTPAACPSGCCAAPLGSNPAADKVCQAGTTDLACGTAGETCSDCVGQGQGGLCLGQKCAYPTPCKCANGCCDRTGQCQPGASNTQCGSSSNAYGYCVDCTPYGTQCDFQSCIAAGDAGVCNEQTCPNGCCDSNEQCQQGLTSTSCGNFGTTCQNCLPAGVCSNQKCTTPDGGRLCSATNCPDGCCDGAGRCQSGSEATLCGAHGAQCVDCTPFGDRCEAGACTAPDGATLCAQTCSGCCDPSGACQPGIADAQCGEGGGACTNCAALAAPSTCDVHVSPRTCSSLQMVCPAPYVGCPAPLEVPAPVKQKVCASGDLQSAGSACATGLLTSACINFLTFESGSNVDCGNCLQRFAFDFADQTGVLLCAAPYVDAACNHQSACLADCLAQSCYGCADVSSKEQCETQAQTAGCSAFVQTDGCGAQALAGPAAFCNPATYQALPNQAGAWFQAVATAYCAQ